MATSHNCTKNCGCKDTYVVTPPCPPSCPEVFNASCIVYTGTDITCNGDVVISRYDYMDTIVTKLVNYICNVVAPVTTVVGSTYVDVVPATVGNVTTYTVSVNIPALQAYFDLVIQNDLLASILAGPGILVSPNPITGTVTVSHQDTSSVANLNSDNSGNSFIQDIFFTFDTFGHVTGASVVPGSVIQPNDFDRAQINPDSGFVWGPDNDPTNIQIAEAPGDTLNFVAGTGITLNASTVPGTDAIRITNSSPASAVSLTSAGGLGTESLVNDGAGPTLANKGLAAGSGITLTSTATDVTISADVRKYTELLIAPLAPGGTAVITHNLNTFGIVVSAFNEALPVPFVVYTSPADYTYVIDGANQITVTNTSLVALNNFSITVIG
jgi:hypothetical protein